MSVVADTATPGNTDMNIFTIVFAGNTVVNLYLATFEITVKQQVGYTTNRT